MGGSGAVTTRGANPELVDRDRLLDVRRHVEITAERYSADG